MVKKYIHIFSICNKFLMFLYSVHMIELQLSSEE